jgi:hypothetical protein
LDGKRRSLLFSIFIKSKKIALISNNFLIFVSKLLNIKFFINRYEVPLIDNIKKILNELKFNLSKNDFNIHKHYQFKKDLDWKILKKSKNNLHLHIDEKWFTKFYYKDYTNVNLNYNNLILFLKFIIEKFKCHIIITTGSIELPIIKNIKANLFSFDAGARYRIDNDILLDNQVPFTVFLGAGVGYSLFSLAEDQYDENNQKYHYWSDGTIRNNAETDLDAANAEIIYRNYDFETTIETENKGFLYSYFELGFGLKITSNLNAQFVYKHNFAFSDQLDGISTNSKKDKFVYLSAGMLWYFGLPERTNSEILQAKAAEKIHLEDLDDDGVPDVNDFCAKTPRGWEVDNKGCPLDDDGDGVPNKLDKEANTAKGSLINKEGVTVTEEELEVMYLLQSGEMDSHPNYQEYKKKYPKLFFLFYGEEVIQKTESISE